MALQLLNGCCSGAAGGSVGKRVVDLIIVAEQRQPFDATITDNVNPDGSWKVPRSPRAAAGARVAEAGIEWRHWFVDATVRGDGDTASLPPLYPVAQHPMAHDAGPWFDDAVVAPVE